VEAQASKGAVMTYRSWDFSARETRAENATACRLRVAGCYRLWVKRFSALDRLRESLRTGGQMSTVLHRNDKNDKNEKNALPPTRNLQAVARSGRIRGAGDKLKLCSVPTKNSV
jgi:hypothetical protein